MGNSVCVPVVEAIATEILNHSSQGTNVDAEMISSDLYSSFF
ncbi:MAG: hypothetical protein LH628_27815 [Microcoleus sp. CAN_BIN18]|nr:hypothetical protein [Microcoleus sp. CAN_BIN18]